MNNPTLGVQYAICLHHKSRSSLLCIQRVFNLKYKPFAFRALNSLNIEQPFSEDSENHATSHANAKSQNHTVRIYKLCRLTLGFIISVSSYLFRFAAHRSKFGIFTVTKHPSIRAFVPKKSNLKFFCVPDELGSQIVLRI